MNKIIRYLVAYIMWVVNSGLALWLFFISRNFISSFLALFYEPGNLTYGYQVEFIDKISSILLGLGWLIFVIITESYFRVSVEKGNTLKRITRVTGGVLLAIFIVDLLLFWLQGAGGSTWLRWLILAVELGFGTLFLVLAKTRFTSPSR
jgi:hypothetical protein